MVQCCRQLKGESWSKCPCVKAWTTLWSSAEGLGCQGKEFGSGEPWAEVLNLVGVAINFSNPNGILFSFSHFSNLIYEITYKIKEKSLWYIVSVSLSFLCHNGHLDLNHLISVLFKSSLRSMDLSVCKFKFFKRVRWLPYSTHCSNTTYY